MDMSEMHKQVYGYFPVTYVGRADVIEALLMHDRYLTRKSATRKANSLTDDEMMRIAEDMADAYTNEVFWIDLDIIARQVMEDRDED